MKKYHLCFAFAVALWLVPGLAVESGQVTEKPAAAAECCKVMQNDAQSRADRLDAYFKANGMPLAGQGKAFVAAADQYGVDWRLLPAISVQESGGGRRYIRSTNNPFGWGSGRIKFASIPAAINGITKALGTGPAYKGKTTRQKLLTYNPPSAHPTYAAEVLKIMEKIGR